MKNRVNRETLVDFLNRLDATFARPGHVYLIGETTQVFEGMRTWAHKLEFTADVDRSDRAIFSRVIRDLGDEMGVAVLDESPGDLIPLPKGYETRARNADRAGKELVLNDLLLRHFDPYSVSYRFIARGDESDYHVVLTFLQHGWVEFDRMDTMLDALLPRFSTETIQQDPAEFRRKYKSLVQMWRSATPHATHRATVV